MSNRYGLGRIVTPVFAGLAIVSLAGAPLANEAETRIPPLCDYGSPHPDAPIELREYEFLIGDFDITLSMWQVDAWVQRPQHARWNGRYILGGRAVMDEWYSVEPAIDPATNVGVNVRMYDPAEKIWENMWLSTGNHQTADIKSQMRDGKMLMWQVYPEPTPKWEAVFEFTDPDNWVRTQYVYGEDGARSPQFRIDATRIPCES